MPNQRFLKNFDLAQATVNQYNDPLVLRPNEFSALTGWISDKGALVSKPPMVRLDIPGVNGGSVHGLHTTRLGTNVQWLIAAVGELKYDPSTATWIETHRTRLVAVATDLRYGGTNVAKRVISSVGISNAFGRRWYFFDYRGKVFASNGEESFLFDGDKWVGPNNTNSDDWRRCGTEISWWNGQEFYGRCVLANTPHYPNEITWTDIYADVDTTTKWTGYNEVGGTGVSATLYGLVQAPGRLIAVGDSGTALTSDSYGYKWTRLSVPTTFAQIKDVDNFGIYVWAVGGDSGNGPYAINSSDGGTTWTRVTNMEAPGCSWNRVFVASSSGILVVGEQAGSPAARVTGTGGSAWIEGQMPSSGIGALQAGLFTGNSNYYIAVGLADGDGVMRPIYSSNGLNWQFGATPTNIATDMFAVVRTGGQLSTERDCLAVGASGAIWATTDVLTGVWNQITVPGTVTATLRDVDRVANSQTLYACGDSGTVIKSSDAGVTWVDLSTNLSTSSSLRALSISAMIGGDYRIVVVGDAGFVAYSDDGGNEWTIPSNEGVEANKFIDAYYLGNDEEIRCTLKAHGLLYVFTDRNAYVFDQQFSQRSVTNGIEVFNDRCVAEYGGKFWLLGKYNGVNGLYVWDGVNQPVLASRPFQTLLDSITLDAAPRSVIFKVDTESEMTPTDGGFYYDADKFSYEDGVLVLHKGESDEYIYSHGNSSGAVDTTGFYVPDMSNTNGSTKLASFGTLGIEIALNESGQTPYTTYCKVYARFAPTKAGVTPEVPDDTKWTNWTTTAQEAECSLVPLDAGGDAPTYSLPYSGQQSVFARYNLHIDHTQLDPTISGYDDDNEPYQWMQFKIKAGNNTNNPSNWRLNRIILRPQARLITNTSIAIPNLTVWDDKLWVSLGVASGAQIIAVGNGGATMSVCQMASVTNPVTSLIPHGGRLVAGMTSKTGTQPTIHFTNTAVNDADGFTSIVTTGRCNLSDADPRYAHIRKKLKRIFLMAKPKNIGTATVYVSWYPDGRTSAMQTQTLTFDNAHDPNNSHYQYREIEVSSPYQTNTSGGSVDASSYGHDFTVSVTTYSPSYIDLYQLAVEFEMATPDVKESDGAAEL